MRCSKCGADNQEIARFCESCGGQLEVKIPRALALQTRAKANASFAILDVIHCCQSDTLKPRRLKDKRGSNPGMIIDRVVSTYTLVCARAIAWGENRRSGFLRSQKRLTVTENSSSKLRVFQLLRDEDPSGVSGVGRVAVGVVFPSGKVVLEWLGAHSTFGIYDDLRRVEHIHGHGGKTRIVFTRGAIQV